MLTLGTDNMFRGKYLPGFFEQYAPLYRWLVQEHGQEKVWQVYDYFFGFVSKLQWGQWMVLDKVCPKVEMRQLFYWVMECIYQSDLCSQMRWEWAAPSGKPSGTVADELRIVVVEPPAELMKKWEPFLGQRRYLYIDWFGRLRRDPGCNADIKPEWLMLEVQSEWGSVGEQQNDGLTSDD